MATSVMAWPTVALGEVLGIVSRPVAVQANQMYALLGMHWYAEGLYIKDRKLGSQIQASTLYQVRTGDFVYNRLFGWKGSFGIADESVDGCYVSNEFPCFQIDETRLHPAFLRWYFTQERVWEHVQAQSSGSTPTSRLRLKEGQFLALDVPLPPLDEQRRIVARIEALAARIAEARGLRQAALAEAEALLNSIADEAFPRCGATVVGDFVSIQSGYAFQSEWFSDDGIRLARNINVGHGTMVWNDTVRLPLARRSEFSNFELSEGDLLISLDRPIISTGVKVARVRVGDLPALLLQRVGRVRFRRDDISPDYFYVWLRSPKFITAIDPGRSNGVPHVSPRDIERIPFSPPPLDEQLSIASHLAGFRGQIEALKHFYSETAAELDALLPSLLDKAFRGEL